MTITTLPTLPVRSNADSGHDWQWEPDINDIQAAISAHRRRVHRRRSWAYRILLAAALAGACIAVARLAVYIQENKVMERYFDETFTR